MAREALLSGRTQEVLNPKIEKTTLPQTVVILIQVVVIILVIALLTLPAAKARHYARSVGQMMVLACFLGAIFTTSGPIVSFGPNLPAGATIVVIAGVVYLLVTIVKGLTIRLNRRRPMD